MKRQLVLRGALGFPLGIAIGYIISILVSLAWANGYYSPCVPELIAITGSEISAVVLQALLCGLLGTGFAASSVIWEVEHWSLAKQTGIYFGINAVIMMPIAYLTYWMEHSVLGFLSYFGVFALIFLVVWILQFTTGRRMVRKMNAGLHQTVLSPENKKEGTDR